MTSALKSPDSFTEKDNVASACKACGVLLDVPWIRCVKCQPNLDICTHCFSFGAEFESHENDHPYMVMRFNFPLYEASWTAADEIHLLDAIQEYGLGNWSAVSGRIRTKSAEDCERHYFKYYVEKPQPPLPEFEDPEYIDKGAPVTFKLSENPPRPAEGSPLWLEMGGYSAARCDFNIEYDNFIEMDICNLTVDDNEEEEEENIENDESEEENKERDKSLYRDLQLAVLDVYRNCLIERQKRRKIVRDYGLINIRRWYGIFKRRYEQNLSLDFLRPFMRLFSPVTFDKFLESLLYEKQLKANILKLQEYRRNGISRLKSVRTYMMMRQRRDSTKSQRNFLTDVLQHVQDELSCQSWLAKQIAMDSSSKSSSALTSIARKTAPRLRIEGLPGYEKLTDAEKELCSEVRLVPEAFLDFSRILVSECAKQGYLRLAQARMLIKIDVNKTRKLYDFLVNQGQINKEKI